MKYELSTIAYYERNAERFWVGTRDHDVTQNYNAFLKSMTGDGPYKILDFGCGPGSGMAVLRDAFPQASLLGIDISETAIEHARIHYGDLAQFEAGDHTMLSDADVIICSNVLEHLDDDLSVARVLWERTAKHLFITVPYQESPLNPEHLRTYNSGHFDRVVPNCAEHVFPSKYWSEYGRRHFHLHLKNLGRRLRGRPVRQRKMQIMFRADRT